MRALLFPGQGTQFTGMGLRFCHHSEAARSVYARANDVLGRDIATLCFRASPDVLRDTRNAQPAVVVTNLAAAAMLLERGFTADAVAGHSVGEISALVVAGCLEMSDALMVTRMRAELMGRITARGRMVAIVGIEPAFVEAACENAMGLGPVVAAVHNSDTNTVVSGTSAAVASVVEVARRVGARAVELNVSHAFHSPLMETISQDWAKFLAKIEIRTPRMMFFANSSAEPIDDGQSVRAAMVDQVASPVRWRQIIRRMIDGGITHAIEAGDSRALASFNRNINPGLKTLSLGDPRDLRKVLDCVPTS